MEKFLAVVLSDLKGLVETSRLRRVWHNTVRTGLRKQTAPDLHDYLDIHYNLDVFCKNLQQAVLTGAYRPREPDVIVTEKGKGLLRHLLVPSPADALLLQALTDELQPVILRRRPSARAFYSRSHQRPDIENLYTRITYPWWVKWARFVEQIWEFRKTFPYLVVTDVANYFDNIDTTVLRNRLAGFARINEAHLDLLLHILDAIKAHSFYGTRNRLSLPQIDFDAPRLLATAYLFEADHLLKKRTRNCFVRWMDDIDFGAKTREEATAVIGELDRRLHGLNVRLNSGKTRILTDKEAESYFWITENVRLNKLKKRLERWKGSPSGRSWRRAVLALEKAARVFLKTVRVPRNQLGQWEKVYKRYLGLLAVSRSTLFEPQVASLLQDRPALRGNVVGYLRALGYSPSRWRVLKTFIARHATTDQAACLDAAQVLVQWQVPQTSGTERRALALVRRLRAAAKHSPGPFVVGLIVLAKYGRPRSLAEYIRHAESAWRYSPWALRQVAACCPLLDVSDGAWLRDRIMDAAAPEAVSVLVNLKELEERTSVSKQLRQYLTYSKNSPYGWPLSKFIISMAILARAPLTSKARAGLLSGILGGVTDPVYSTRLSAAAQQVQGTASSRVAP